MKDKFNITIPCEVYKMNGDQLKDYVVALRNQADHDHPYCLDDPDGSLESRVEKMYAEAMRIDNILLSREVTTLKTAPERKTLKDVDKLLFMYKHKMLEYDNPSGHSGCTKDDCEFVHINWMLDEIAKLTDEGKIQRWICFIQGYFWTMGIYSIDQMREHIRSILVT